MIGDIELVGGTMQYKVLDTKLSEKDYAIKKAIIWHGLLGTGKKPIHWRKPSKKGTALEFEFIRSQEEYDNALPELEAYLVSVNKLHGTDLEINRSKEAAQ